MHQMRCFSGAGFLYSSECLNEYPSHIGAQTRSSAERNGMRKKSFNQRAENIQHRLGRGRVLDASIDSVLSNGAV